MGFDRLVDAIVGKAGEVIEDKADGWMSRGLREAHGAVDKAAEGVDPNSFEGAMLAEATRGLGLIGVHSSTLVGYGKARAAGVLIHISTGNDKAARLLALAGASTFEQRRAASAQSTAQTEADTKAREEAHEAMVAMAKDIGLGALKAALPFILAAL